MEDPEVRPGGGAEVAASAPGERDVASRPDVDINDQANHVNQTAEAIRSHWWVACADPFGRSRAMNVVIQQDRVVVVAPPGQAAVLSAQETRQLGRALDRAFVTLAGPAPG